MKFVIILVAIVGISNALNPPKEKYKVCGNYYIWNNGWNDTDNKIQVHYGSGTEMTAKFNFPNKAMYGYPAICRGWHYNVNPTNCTLFPRQVSSIKSIPVTFAYTSRGVNMAGDFAYDIFFRRDIQKDKPQLEIMIWGDHNSCPIGKLSDTNVIHEGHRTFDLWEGQNGAAGYFVYSFVPHGTVVFGENTRPLATKGTLNLDIKPFLNWLQKHRAKDGHYSDSLYLHVIEAGFEVVRGNGLVNMKSTINAI